MWAIKMSSVIAHQLMDEAIEIDVDGVPENAQSTLTLSRDGEMKASFAQCCHPIPGDPIVALSTAKKGVVVHHQACSNLVSSNTKRFLLPQNGKRLKVRSILMLNYTLKCLMSKMH